MNNYATCCACGADAETFLVVCAECDRKFDARIKAHIAELEEALKPFAEIARRDEYQPKEYADGSRSNYPDGMSVGRGLTLGDFRRAAAVLVSTPTEQDDPHA